MAPCGGRSRLARQHSRQLDQAVLALHFSGRGHRPALPHLFGDGHLGIGERGHLGQVSDDEDLVPGGGKLVQSPADGERRFATDAGVDLVEDEGRGRLAQHEPSGEHHAGQLAPRCDLLQREGRLARVRSEQETHLISPPTPHDDLEPAFGQGEVGEVRLDRLGKPGRCFSSGVAQLLLGFPEQLGCTAPFLLDGVPQILACFEIRQSLPGGGLEADHVAQPIAVLPPELRQQVSPGLHRAQALRIVLECLFTLPKLSCHVGELALHAPEPGGQVPEWIVSIESGRRDPDQVGCSRLIPSAVPAGQTAPGGLHCEAKRLSGAEDCLFGLEAGFFVGVADRCGLELANLESQQVDLTRQLSRVPSDLAPEDFEPKRQELNTAIEFARLRSYDYFKKARA